MRFICGKMSLPIQYFKMEEQRHAWRFMKREADSVTKTTDLLTDCVFKKINYGFTILFVVAFVQQHPNKFHQWWIQNFCNLMISLIVSFISCSQLD